MSDDLAQELMRRMDILERKVADMIVEGVVSQVQPHPYRVKVDYGTTDKPLHTGWLPVAPMRSGSANVWWALEVGEGVTIISVDGILERGRVFPSRYTEDHLPPSANVNEFQFNFGDGGCLHYNRQTGEALLKAITKITLDSNVHITKKLTVVDTSTAADHLSGSDNISGKNHLHNESIGSTTAKPHN